MTDERTLPFAGTPEELEKYLQEFTRLTGSMAGRKTGGGWLVSGGAGLSSNPNTVPWRIEISRTDAGLALSHRVGGLPWTRPKLFRIGAYRAGQLADFLTSRVRGSGPEKFDPYRLREPFAPFGASVAAATASFAWTVAAGLAAFAGAFLAAVLVSLPLMSLSIREIAAHSAALQQAGEIPLPSPAEAAATGALGPALVFALPIAFFAGLVHWAALAACDAGFRPARVPQASFLFLTIFVGLALFPFLPILAVPLAPLIPLGAQLGASIVWSRRRERVREGPRPQKAVVLIGVCLAASLAGVLVPPVSAWKENLPRIARFRDGWLLGNGIGKRIATTYYRYTLYTAEPIKEMYSMDPSRAARAQPLAGCADPAATPRLRALGFSVTAPSAPHDVLVGPGGIDPGKDPGELKLALDDHSRRTFRGGALRDLNSYAWGSLYYAGPLVVTIVLMGMVAPVVSILFRKLQSRQAVFALTAVSIVSILVLVLVSEKPPGAVDPAVLAETLTEDARSERRQEAAFRAFQLESTAPLADALVKASDDPDLRVRLWAVAALGKSGDPRALSKIVARLDDPEIFVRYRASEGLEFLKHPDAAAPLEKAMRERSWYEGLYALHALRAIRPGKY
jgi:hypothetical protein